MSNPPYRWNATDYARNSSAQFSWAQELIAKLHLRGNESVLDIGCGDGKITAMLARRAPHGRVVGIDSSAGMVALASRDYCGERCRNLRFEMLDARAMRFDNEFDVVFSNATLHWVRDHVAVLRGIEQGLRPDGRILLQMGGRGNAADVIAVMDTVRASPNWQGYFSGFEFPYAFYGPEDYVVWLAHVGLEMVRVELMPKDMTHRDREAFAGWLSTTWHPYIDRVPEEQRGRFLSAVVDEYLARHPIDTDGATHVEMVRLEVEAQKRGQSTEDVTQQDQIEGW
ncbi:MAG: methyltransferase domain-containing protein [Chloroflexi bacterium]|nr:methyltransferase domain-containing protein [Chloroflexota bacterium]